MQIISYATAEVPHERAEEVFVQYIDNICNLIIVLHHYEKHSTFEPL